MSNIFEKMATAKPVNNFGDDIVEGDHVLSLASYEVRETENKGDIIAADFFVVESTGAHKPGDFVRKGWFISNRGWQGEREMSEAQAFVKALLGIDDGEAAGAAASKLVGKEQPGRGIVVGCRGKKNKNGYTNTRFVNVEQSPEAIKASRADVEAKLAEVKPPAKPEAEVNTAFGNLFG